MEIPKSTYTYKTKLYGLDSILNFYNNNKIDLELDCQRGEVWTFEKKQSFIDTLLNRERIPELHAIKEDSESVFHIADGKQRLTTIVNFLSNKLKWELKYADKKFAELFGTSSELYFKDLPETFQNMILDTEIPIACYQDMTLKTITKLFRKLNNGTALDSFCRELANNIVLKRDFLVGLMNHPCTKKIFSESQIQKSQAEEAYIRLLILMQKYDKEKVVDDLDLKPDVMFKKYIPNLEEISEEEAENWKTKTLQYYQNIILKYLDILFTADKIRLRSTSAFVFSVFIAYKKNYKALELISFYLKMKEKTVSEVLGRGDGQDYGNSNIKKYLSTYEKESLDNAQKTPFDFFKKK